MARRSTRHRREPIQAISPQAAYITTNILMGNTVPSQNPIWAEKLEAQRTEGLPSPGGGQDRDGERARDLATYGYLAPPADPAAPAAVRDLDGQQRPLEPAAVVGQGGGVIDGRGPAVACHVRDITAGTPVADFRSRRPRCRYDRRLVGRGRPSHWTRDRVKEWFIDGTQPGTGNAIDLDGLLYSRACGGWRVDPVKAELGPSAWDVDVADWLARARRGVGVEGRHESRTAYFWASPRGAARSWGPATGPSRSRNRRSRPRRRSHGGEARRRRRRAGSRPVSGALIA